MALPAQDAFTAANGTNLTTYSANWTVNSGSFAINTNALIGGTSILDNLAHWNADVFANDQYAQVVAAAVSSGNYGGPAVRLAASAATGYFFQSDSADGLYLYKIVAGSETQLGSTGSAIAANDLLRLEINGTTLTPKKNGSLIATPGAQTDSAIASGSAGVNIYNDSTTFRLDSWEGGNLGSAAASLLVPRKTWRGYR